VRGHFALTPESLQREIAEYEEEVGLKITVLRVSRYLVPLAQQIIGSSPNVIDSAGRVVFDGKPLENVFVPSPLQIIEMPEWPDEAWNVAPS